MELENATISGNKIYIDELNAIEAYVLKCINDAAERLKDHHLVKDNPLQYVIKKIICYDQAFDHEWQPYAAFAKHNLADTETALDWIKENYKDFQECVNNMADDMGAETFYGCIFQTHEKEHNFDLVKLTVTVYTEIAHKIGIAVELID